VVVFLMSQDRLLQETIRLIHDPRFHVMMEGATLSADFRLLFILFGFLWVGGTLARRKKAFETNPRSIIPIVWIGKWGIIVLFVTRVVVEIAKALIGRARPYMIDPGPGPGPGPGMENHGPLFFGPVLGRDFASFPSGHATSAAAVAVVLAWAFPKARYPLCLWVALVCLSRVALNDHFVSDVAAGAILGYCLARSLMGAVHGSAVHPP
jgi:membrane-associated phospholipid phosphatase